MAKIKFSNFASTNLVEDLPADSSTLSVVLEDVSAFPKLTPGMEEYFHIYVQDNEGNFEIMKVINVDHNVFTVVRGIDNTSPKEFLTGHLVEHRLTAQSLRDLANEARTPRPHASTTKEFGGATTSFYGHARVIDDVNDKSTANDSVAASPYYVKKVIANLLQFGEYN